MNLLLVETRGFTEAIPDYFEDDESYRCFQEYLMESPDAGAVMRGCAVFAKCVGKMPGEVRENESGLRIIYLHLPEFEVLGLVDVYGKNEAEDLSTDERRTVQYRERVP